MNGDRRKCLPGTVHFLGKVDDHRKPLEVEPSGDAGDRHERQERGYHQKKEVVPGVDGGKSEEEGNDDVQEPGAGDFQTSGTGIFFRTEFNSASLSMLSLS